MWIKSQDGHSLFSENETVCFSIEKSGEYQFEKYYLKGWTKYGQVFNISTLYKYDDAKEALKFIEDQLIPPQTNTKLKEMEVDNHGDS